MPQKGDQAMNINQQDHSEGEKTERPPSLSQRFLKTIKNSIAVVRDELVNDTSAGVCHIASVVGCLVATASFLYAFISLVISYATGATHFSISMENTTFGAMYLSGWVGIVVAVAVGVMLVSAAIAYVRERTGVSKVLCAILAGLMALTYVNSCLLFGDFADVYNNEILIPLVNGFAFLLSSLSLNPFTILPGALLVVAAVGWVATILLAVFAWRSERRTLVITCLKTVACVYVLFKALLAIADYIGSIVGVIILVAIGLLVIWVFTSGDGPDHSIFTNDLGERIKVNFIDDKWKRL